MARLRDRRWAPWWAYVAVAAGLNLLRQLAFPPSDVGTFWTIVLFVIVLAFAAAAVSAGHRVARRFGGGRT